VTAVAAPPQRIRIADQRETGVATVHFRLMVVLLAFVFATFLILAKLAWMAAFAEPAGRGDGAGGIAPARADIVDRNGVTLARSIDAWSIAVHPGKILSDPRVLAAKLAALMPERTEAQYLRILRSGRNFVYLRRRALPETVRRVNALGEPGMALGREPERLYPQGPLAAHVVGYTNLDGIGAAGLEREFNARLTDRTERATPLQLSIDARVQQALESQLNEAMAHFSAIGAAGIIMDLRTSEVLALTSLPEINPNAPGKASPEAGFNRATLGVYELGSTFKPFTVAMAMDSGIIKSFGDMYDCPRALKAGRFTITDTHPYGRRCSVAEIMKESSNIGTAQIAAKIGADRQRAFLKQMGFLDPVSIELAERGRTLSPGSNWGEIATMTVGYGHGIAVTPLHLATGYATLFNGGIWRPATLLKVGPHHPVPPGRRVFSEDASLRMRALLRLVVTSGTGKNADAPGYRVGGKTGTAEKILNGRYTHSAVVTTFAGVFPMDDPRYVVIAMLDEPKGTKETFGFHTAGWNVAPVVKQVVARIGPLLGIEPDEGRDVDLSQVMQFVRPEKGH